MGSSNHRRSSLRSNIAIFGGAVLVTMGVGGFFALRARKAPVPVVASARPARDGAVEAELPSPKASLVELLHSVPAMVAVSSSVKNQSDRPEGLVDGSLKTAWNSRTGELQGAWIAFRIPSDTRVSAIKMTAGFVYTKGTEDLFAMNHRVRKVRLRNDASVFAGAGDAGAKPPSVSLEWTLDPESRELQVLNVDLPGGDYLVEVAEVVPGVKKAWREIAVSEFQVWGTLPKGQAAVPQEPSVRVGSANVLTMSAALGPYASIDDYCASFLKEVGRGVGGVEPLVPACKLVQTSSPSEGPFKTFGYVESNEGGDHELLKLALETDRGWYVAHLKKYGGAHPGCGGNFYGEHLLSRAARIEGSGVDRVLVATTVVKGESGQTLSPEEEIELGYKSYRSESIETSEVICGVAEGKGPACSSELRTSFSQKTTPQDGDGDELSEAKLVVRSRTEVDVSFVRGKPTSVADEGRHVLAY